MLPAGEVAGAGNLAMSAEVGLDEIAAIVAADVPGVVAEEVEGTLRLRTVSTGATASIQVDPASTLDDQLGLDNDPHLGAEGGASNALRVEGKDPGAFANRLEVEVRPPTGGEAGFFDLAVIEDGVYREVFANVTTTPGAFRSREPDKAFFVDVSDRLNTPSIIFAGKLIARVGLATNKPAEFIILRISQDTPPPEAELAAAGA